MNFRFWLSRLHLIPARVVYHLWERRHSDKPWLTPAAVRFCATRFAPPMRGWEFGSGRSTAWYAAHLGHLVSIEHHTGWYNQVRAQLVAKQIGNVDYRLVPLAHPETEPERHSYDPVPEYVAVIDREPDESLDMVVVDGHYRSHCIRHSLRKLRSGGLLLIDDLNLWPDRATLPVPPDWSQVHKSSNGLKQTGIWQKPAAKPYCGVTTTLEPPSGSFRPNR